MAKQIKISAEEAMMSVAWRMPIYNCICSECGALCFDNDSYCAECGNRFNDSDETESAVNSIIDGGTK